MIRPNRVVQKTRYLRHYQSLCHRITRLLYTTDIERLGCLAALCIEFLKALHDFLYIFLPAERKNRKRLVVFSLSFLLMMLVYSLADLSNKSFSLDLKNSLVDAQALFGDISLISWKSTRVQTADRAEDLVKTSVYEPDCDALLNGNQDEVLFTKAMIYREYREKHSDQYYSQSTKNCTKFRTDRDYPEVPTTKEEQDFPIAYIMTVHKNVEQVERLLRMIYAPQNIYCVHVDKKSSGEFHGAIINIAKCFPNVFIASKLEEVVYAGYTRLLADINCLKDLLKSDVQWRYAINLAGQDFPLKTNYQIIHALKSLNGSNDIPGVAPTSSVIKSRFTFIHTTVMNENLDLVITNQKKIPPPGNINILHGSAYILASRPFVQYVIRNSYPISLLEWFNDTYSPDEHYWASLQRLVNTPGGNPVEGWASIARAIKWSYYDGTLYPKCEGKYIRNVCVFGIGDLNWLIGQKHLFANKFDIEYDHMAIKCLEHRLLTATKAELVSEREHKPLDNDKNNFKVDS